MGAAHDEAWKTAKGQFTKGREIVTALASLVLTGLILVSTGHKKDVFALVVGGVVALLVGLLLLPVVTYIGSCLTHRSRQTLTAVGSLLEAVNRLREPFARDAGLMQENERARLVSMRAIHEELLFIQAQLEEVAENGVELTMAFPLDQWTAHKAVIAHDPIAYRHVEHAMVKVRQINILASLGTGDAKVISVHTAKQLAELVQAALIALDSDQAASTAAS